MMTDACLWHSMVDASTSGCREMAVTWFAASGFSLSSPMTSEEARRGWVSNQSLRARLMGSIILKTMRGGRPWIARLLPSAWQSMHLQILTAGAANRMICPIILEAIRRLVELGLKVTK